jgi:cytochrome b561
MVTLKKLLSLVVITGIASALIIWTFISFEFRSSIFAFLINWLVMSWVAVMGQFVTFPSFPSSYYEIKPFEQSGRVYEQLGVSLFKKIVRRSPFTVFSPTLRFPPQKTTPALRNLENEMRKAETSHMAIFFMILVLVIYALINGWFDAIAWLLFFNIIFNGYPVMLQRYNRIKIQELVNKG